MALGEGPRPLGREWVMVWRSGRSDRNLYCVGTCRSAAAGIANNLGNGARNSTTPMVDYWHKWRLGFAPRRFYLAIFCARLSQMPVSCQSLAGDGWISLLSGMDTVVSAFQFLLLSGAFLLAGSLELSRGPCRCYCESVLGCGYSGFCFVD